MAVESHVDTKALRKRLKHLPVRPVTCDVDRNLQASGGLDENVDSLLLGETSRIHNASSRVPLLSDRARIDEVMQQPQSVGKHPSLRHLSEEEATRC